MLQEALMGMIGKPTKKLVHVDFAEKLAEIGLAKYFPHEVQESLVVPRIAWSEAFCSCGRFGRRC